VRPRARFALALAPLLGAHALLAWSIRVPSLTTNNDDAWYLALARALRAGAYVELPIAGMPPHAKYPPLYPALLALLGITSPARIELAVVVDIALSVAALALFALAVRRWSEPLALAALVAVVPNRFLLEGAAAVRSEPLCMACAMLALWLLGRERRDARTDALAIAAVIASALARAIGVTFIVAALAFFLIERRWRRAAWLAVAASLTFGVWLAWSARESRRVAGASYIADAMWVPRAPAATADTPSAGASNGSSATRPGTSTPDTPPRADTSRASAPSPAPGTPTGPLAVLAHRVRTNVPAYLAAGIPAAVGLVMLPGTRADNIAWLAVVLVLGGIGAVAMARRLPALALFAGAYLALVLVWPWIQTRYLSPIIPILALAILAGLAWIVDRVARERASVVVIVAGIALAAGALWQLRDRVALGLACDRDAPLLSPSCFSREQREYFAAALAARHLVPDTAVVAVAQEATFYLLSGRRAIPEALAESVADPRAFASLLDRWSADYILLTRVAIGQWALVRPLRPDCRAWDVVGTVGPHVALLHRRASGGATIRGDACAAIARWASGRWSDPDDARW
jgi:hypothetical protein